jgi:hypothetical protein
MRFLIISLSIFLISCAQIEVTNYSTSLKSLHQVWQEKEIGEAKKKIKGLKLIEEDEEYQTWGIPKPGMLSTPLTIFVNKKAQKIESMMLSLYDRDKNGTTFIKSQIQAADWQTIERPIKNHPLRQEISEYSESKGVSFLYEKSDPKKEVNVIYWGSDPKKINW